MDRPFMPKYGSVSQVLLQLVVAMARMDQERMSSLNGHGLELEKAGPIFSSLNAMLAKILWYCSLMKFV